ncbi:tubulin-specific chaperone cofactor E-like protein [Acanthaster planci]|uniref:Tubulin-specific chaperone cofactor E-like protein n=1 Tax=Acanthaster planci TaxID=133434 RepID=A0A8B7Y6S7_ACAPL|nr:tubulin-specific chaperone cofactor E-like protein [Acanthaster planci]
MPLVSKIMDEQTSFVDALKAKYCECENDAVNEGSENFVQITVFGSSCRRRPRSDCAGEDSGQGNGHDGKEAGDDCVPELGYLKNVTLYNSGITHAAIPSTGLSSLCPNVHDLDLSGNLLSSWHEVKTILKNLPCLKFVNLSSNPLGNLEIVKQEQIPCCIEDLVLNDTKVSWSEVAALSRLMPKLKQLHLCKNEYNTIDLPAEETSTSLGHLHVLALNNNRIKRWNEVAKLKSLPKLRSLVLMENPLEDVFYKQAHSTASDERSAEKEKAGDAGDKERTQPGDTAKSESFCAENVGEKDGVSCEQNVALVDKDNEANIPRWHLKENKQALGSELVATHPKANRNDQSQPWVVMEGEGAISGDASPGSVALETAKDEAVGKASTAESVQSSAGASGSNRECNTMGALESADSQSPVSNKQEQVDAAFPALESLCVTGTCLSNWQDLQELRHFPRLHSVKIKNIPLLESWDEADRRKLAVACLPSIKHLNGSEITLTEREKSERHFVRVFVDHAQPPARLEELVQKHGKLRPLVQVDIGQGFQEFVELKFIYGGRCIHQGVVRVVEPVGKLKQICSNLIDTSSTMVKLYHKTRDPDTDEPVLDELFLDSLPMSRFDMKDGDEILIDLKKGLNRRTPWQPAIKMAP